MTFILKGETSRKVTDGAGVEALEHPASLRRLQGHVLAESSVEAEGEREAASHPLPLLETSGRRLHVQQDLRPVVVGQGHAAHQPEGRQTDRRWLDREPTRVRGTLSDGYRPGDHQLLSVVDAVRAAVVVWESAANLSLDVIKLHLCGAL